MTLHICTPAYRYDFLDKVYESIPKNSDILWHIAKTSRREKLTNEFLKDNRVIVYEVDCDDSDTVAKRNAIFDNIGDGYFHLLDDDTEFINTMYTVYQVVSSDKTERMVIGRQYTKERTLRPFFFDSGNMLCHASVLKEVRWTDHYDVPKDFVFWTKAISFFKNQGRDRVLQIETIISIYNSLR